MSVDARESMALASLLAGMAFATAALYGVLHDALHTGS